MSSSTNFHSMWDAPKHKKVVIFRQLLILEGIFIAHPSTPQRPNLSTSRIFASTPNGSSIYLEMGPTELVQPG